jgi:hypothetical protein
MANNKNSKKRVCAPEKDIASVENKIRDLINWVEVKKTEDEIDSELAEDINDKLRKIAESLGYAFD